MSAPSQSEISPILDLRTEVTTALRDFYRFLTKLPWFEPDDLLEPPEHGWPNINCDNFAEFNKSSGVIELLRHLPYVRMDGPSNEYKLAWSTYPCDYRRDYFQQFNLGLGCWEIPDTTERDFEFPEWVIPLTYGKVNGLFVMLDTMDGTAMRYDALTIHDPIFKADDPRAWRNECWNAGSTARLGDILDELKADYVGLHFIGHPSRYGPLFLTEGLAENYKELRTIMLRHGWPDKFDREGCREAMLSWDRENSQKLFDSLNKRHTEYYK